MAPAFVQGDFLAVTRFERRSLPDASPSRGDVVISTDPRDSTLHMLKRIVGLPSDTLTLEDGLLMVNGEHLSEPYLCGLPAYVGTENRSWRIADGSYFLMGDNRARSTDSRDFGPVPESAIVGFVSRRLWPPQRWRAY